MSTSVPSNIRQNDIGRTFTNNMFSYFMWNIFLWILPLPRPNPLVGQGYHTRKHTHTHTRAHRHRHRHIWFRINFCCLRNTVVWILLAIIHKLLNWHFNTPFLPRYTFFVRWSFFYTGYTFDLCKSVDIFLQCKHCAFRVVRVLFSDIKS